MQVNTQAITCSKHTELFFLKIYTFLCLLISQSLSFHLQSPEVVKMQVQAKFHVCKTKLVSMSLTSELQQILIYSYITVK